MYFPDKKLDFNDNFSFILPSISSSAQTAWHRPEIFAEHPCEIEGVPETETGRNLLDRVLLPPQEIPGQRHPVAQHITLRTLSEHRPEKPVQSRHAAAEPLCQRGAGEIHLRIPLNVFEDRIQASEQPALRKGSRLLPEHLQEPEAETRNFRLRPRLFRPEQLQAAVVQARYSPILSVRNTNGAQRPIRSPSSGTSAPCTSNAKRFDSAGDGLKNRNDGT